MRIKLLIFVIAVLSTSTVTAQPQEPLDYDLVRDAVQLAAQVDVYNGYCEKETSLAESFIGKFENRGITGEKKEKIILIKQEITALVKADLAQRKPDCKNVDFLLERLQAMRVLKAVSFALNGIDPSTLPNAGAHIPLEDILLDKPI